MSHGYATSARRDGWRPAIAMLLVVAGALAGTVAPVRADAPAADGKAEAEIASPAADLQDVRKSFLELQRDLVILEEDLLFPASSQVAVFLSMDVGEFFALDAVTLTMDGDDVTHHLYTKRQVDALFRGGVQKLWLGNVKHGEHRLTAVFTGRGPEGRDYRRATTVTFEKTFEPALVELAIRDSTAKYQPEFFAVVDQ